MITVSLCMIVKNEEDVIERCLNSIKDAVDEIIIVDTGSTDSTIEKVNKIEKVKVYHFKWVDDFAKARNYSFSKATMDYILWLDADDVVLDEDNKKFLELKQTLDTDVDAVDMTYIYARDSYGCATVTLKRNRLVKRSDNFKWVGRIHEYIEVSGKTVSSDIVINHYRTKSNGNRNLKIFEKMRDEEESFTARDLYYYGNELYDNGRYKEAIDIYKKFIDTNEGWIEDVKDAFKRAAECYLFSGDEKNYMRTMTDSLQYDLPRPDICCNIANIFFDKGNIKAAIFWYKAAIMNKPGKDNMAIWNEDSYTFIPCIQLCVCYSRLGQFEVANMYNEKAAEYKPTHPSVLHNKKYFIDKI